MASTANIAAIFQQSWNDLPPETKAEYGDEYLRKG